MPRMVLPKSTLAAQLRKGVLEYCVLSLLRHGESYGFDMVRALGDVDGLVTSEGTLYPLLSRLRKDGLVKTSVRDSRAGPPRRYYRITPAGKAALDSFIPEWKRFVSSVNDLLEKGQP